MSKINHRRRNFAEPHPANARKQGIFNDLDRAARQECRERAGYKQHVRHQQRAADRREMVAVLPRMSQASAAAGPAGSSSIAFLASASAPGRSPVRALASESATRREGATGSARTAAR